MGDREDRDQIEIRLRPWEARVSRILNFLLGLLTFGWRWKQEGEPLPGGGRLYRVPRDVYWIGRVVLVLLVGAILYVSYLLWTHGGLGAGR